jgi:hypothetical protein
MELEYLKIANSPIMWISVLPPVALVIFQAALFMKKAIDGGKTMGISTDKMKLAAKSSFFASLGPSIVIVIGMVGLLSSVGGPVAWMRLAYIGSVMYELPAADKAAQAAGSTLGTADMTMDAFANAVWIMTVCCLGWIIVSALFTDKMGTLRDKMAGGNKAALGAIATAGGLGGFGFQVCNRFYPMSAQVYTMVVASLITAGLYFYSKKTNASWVKQFTTTIAMVGGMIVGAFFL